MPLMPRPKTDPWPTMPLALWNACADYLRETANVLGLHDWELIFEQVPCTNEDANAHTGITYGQRKATIALAHDFADLSRKEREVVLIHELIHLHFHHMGSVLEDMLPDVVGKSTAAVILAYQLEREEDAVDALAVALRPLMPHRLART